MGEISRTGNLPSPEPVSIMILWDKVPTFPYLTLYIMVPLMQSLRKVFWVKSNQQIQQKRHVTCLSSLTDSQSWQAVIIMMTILMKSLIFKCKNSEFYGWPSQLCRQPLKPDTYHDANFAVTTKLASWQLSVFSGVPWSGGDKPIPASIIHTLWTSFML